MKKRQAFKITYQMLELLLKKEFEFTGEIYNIEANKDREIIYVHVTNEDFMELLEGDETPHMRLIKRDM